MPLRFSPSSFNVCVFRLRLISYRVRAMLACWTQTPLESLLMGGASKILSTLVTYPTQVSMVVRGPLCERRVIP